MLEHFKVSFAIVVGTIALSLFSLGTPSANPTNQLPTPALVNYQGCGMKGDARSPAVMALNRLKNRYAAPRPDEINFNVTLAAILVPGFDTGRWKIKYGAQITGYVYDVKVGGIEAVNRVTRAEEVLTDLKPKHGL